jgi:L-alanine-DL-glutamate epimerase-like enolase superfamily enzyme
MDCAEHVLVIVRTDKDDLIGVAEGIPRPTIYGETQDSMVAVILDHLSPRICGIEIFDLDRIWARMGEVYWNPGAKAAIDVAVHDAIGKVCGVSINRLLGYCGREVRLTWRVRSYPSLDQVAEDVSKRAQEGFQSFKVKVGYGLEKDVETIRTVREAAGGAAIIYADGNLVFDYESAISFLRRVERWNLTFFEEPIPINDIRGRRLLVQHSRVPILGDESVFTVRDVMREIDLGIIGAISLKVPRTGYYLSRKIITLAEQAGLPMLVGTQAETGLGFASFAQLAASSSRITYPLEISGALNIEDDLITNPLRPVQGRVSVPDRPGLGVDMDWEKVRKYSLKIRCGSV